ncbi:MAG TPA: bifunctional phosphopantothenoylcysteine decarboxylase/phosphopantothenate--cysteine ligase CoaBC [Polyangia bacterium]|nr:bifunctional phosphopantothenoylcysteine decarboxylase/phosphopantothenate--cysteine ligase CoaBC [Polyangia bacterium]
MSSSQRQGQKQRQKKMSGQGLQGRRVVLGVSGGIAAYKTPELVRALVKRGAHVDVVMTPHAAEFVAPLALQVVSKNPVLSDLFDRQGRAEVRHIALADAADLALLAPATANVLAKLAHGVADDVLTTVFLAVRAPTLIAPAMNVHMWEHPATAETVGRLSAWGYRFVGPEEGFLAEGYAGVGRMSEPETIARAAEALVGGPGIARSRSRSRQPRPASALAGVRVLVNAGPTREFLDAVRFLSNPSTGRMGYAIAAEARARGAEVTLVSGPTEIPPPPGVELVRVTSAEEMLAACRRAFGRAAIFVATAAVSDFRPAERAAGKVKKDRAELALRLERTPDILATLAAKKGERLVVGFAAETDDVLRYARDKLVRKDLDLVVANDVGLPGRGFASEDNVVHLVARRGAVVDLGPAPKEEIAAGLWDRIEALYRRRGRRPS